MPAYVCNDITAALQLRSAMMQRALLKERWRQPQMGEPQRGMVPQLIWRIPSRVTPHLCLPSARVTDVTCIVACHVVNVLGMQPFVPLRWCHAMAGPGYTRGQGIVTKVQRVEHNRAFYAPHPLA